MRATPARKSAPAACFRTHDDFDFGTGDPAHDRAMVLPLTGEPFAGETLDLSDLPQES